MSRTLLPGKPYPLGSTAHRKGTNFALFSEGASRVDVCLYDADGNETDCVTLRERTAFVWHGFIRDIKPGQLYNYRVHGPWEPKQGLLFNPAKSLVDPYAKAIAGQLDWKAPIFPYDVASGDPLKMDVQDSASGVPKSVVIHDPFDWSDDCKPETPLPDSVIYETHVKGFSFRNPDIPESLRGTYCQFITSSTKDISSKRD
jgi:glycogen operon protein